MISGTDHNCGYRGVAWFPVGRMTTSATQVLPSLQVKIMDPFAAIVVLCNLMDLTARSVKTFQLFRRIYNTAINHDQAEIQEFVHTMEEISRKLKTHTAQLAGAGNTSDDDATRGLLARIDDICRTLQQIIDTCKPRKAKSFRATFTTMYRSYKNRDDMHKFGEQLEQCQRRIGTIIAANTSMHLTAVMGSLDAVGRSQDDVHKTLVAIKDGIHSSSSDTSKLLEHMMSSQEISHTALNRIHAHRIRQALGEPGNRYEEVPDAAAQTYRWLLENSADGAKDDRWTDDELRNSARLKFTRWLTSGSGIFHISGKAGAGKSSIMKLITRHKATSALLSQWSGSKKLVISKFFFWRNGTWQQNTMRGLFRGLLYDILGYAPDLAPILFPSVASNNTANTYIAGESAWLSLSDDDCSEAFQRLLEGRGISEDSCLCLFIDGLDEFEPSSETLTASHLLDVLQKWTNQMGSQRVKICVSSRPLPAFDNITNDKIHLHLLTKRDMETFTSQELERHIQLHNAQHITPSDRYRLVNNLVNAANGIFLWVSLVVQSVANGIANHDHMSTLEKRIQEMPKGLEPLLNHMFQSIEQCYQWESTLLIAICIETRYWKYKELLTSIYGITLFFIACERSERHENVLRPFGVQDVLAEKTIDEWFQWTTRRVAGRCNGLLEFVGEPMSSTYVTLIHRSIVDFLRFKIPDRMWAYGMHNSQVEKAICWILDAEASQSRLWGNFISHKSMRIKVESLVSGLAIFNGNLSFDTMLLIDHLDRSLAKYCGMSADKIWDDSTYSPRPTLSWRYKLLVVPRGKGTRISVLERACGKGVDQYVSHRLQHDSLITRGGVAEQRLVYSACSLIRRHYAGPTTWIPQLLADNGLDTNCNQSFDEFVFTGVGHFPVVDGKALLPTFDAMWVDLTFTEILYYDTHKASHSINAFHALEFWLARGIRPTVQISLLYASAKRVDKEWRYKYTGHIRQRGNLIELQFLEAAKGVDIRTDMENLTFEDAINIINPPNRDTLLALLHQGEVKSMEEDRAVPVTEESPLVWQENPHAIEEDAPALDDTSPTPRRFGQQIEVNGDIRGAILFFVSFLAPVVASLLYLLFSSPLGNMGH
ncbi:hypothetical protein F4778DRAFT_25090 [Xylariomycetidae sp. FL2044]|nr:hypothetical protein F4778DRAFT_25090 [Xylariomycetidae sp. FL2044]